MATTWLDPASDERVRFVSRKECGLPRSRAPAGSFTRPHAIAHHGVGRGNGLPLREAMAIWRGYHRYHTRNRGWTDIGYSCGWADAPDVGGAVLEGRHWGKDGGHTQNGGNTRGYACAYIGDGREPVADTAWRAWRAWLHEGITAGALSSPPKISGHDDWYPKLCPGSQVKAELHERSQLDRMASEEDELRLTEGSSGKYVGRVQIRLRQFFGTDRIAIDEQYGSQTRDHVAEFQKQKNLLGEGGAEVGVVDWFTYVELIHGAHGQAVDH